MAYLKDGSTVPFLPRERWPEVRRTYEAHPNLDWVGPQFGISAPTAGRIVVAEGGRIIQHTGEGGVRNNYCRKQPTAEPG
jgi:hypothetical protein